MAGHGRYASSLKGSGSQASFISLHLSPRYAVGSFTVIDCAFRPQPTVQTERSRGLEMLPRAWTVSLRHA